MQSHKVHIEQLSAQPSAASLAAALQAREVPYCIWEQNPQSQQKSLQSHVGEFSYLILNPTRITSPTEADPFFGLSQELETHACRRIDDAMLKLFRTPPPFRGGHLALFAHEAVGKLERIAGLESEEEADAIRLYRADTLLVWDRVEGTTYLIDWSGRGAHYKQLLSDCLSHPVLPGMPLKPAAHSIQLGKSESDFIAMVQAAKEYIVAGDVFQVVLQNSFLVNHRPCPAALYQALCEQNPSPYQFSIQDGSFSIVGSSPEMMLYLAPRGHPDREISMRLVAGTYPKHLQTGTALRTDPKEHAEHIMLVDHIRNDIGRVARIGSVVVEDLCAVETYRDVHHLVSQVRGVLPESASEVEAIRATFPIATLTGTPKIRALEIIAELEKRPRGYFGGSVALFGFDGFLESAVIIRSALLKASQTLIHAGAGIVYDSDPAREFKECVWKAQALLRLLSSEEVL